MNIRRFIYQLLDNAFIEAQKAGKVFDELCAPGSAFETDLNACDACIIENSASTNVSVESVDSGQFAQFIEFCASEANSSDASAISSQLSVLSAAATVKAELSSKVAAGSISIVTQTSVLTSVLTQDVTVTVGPGAVSSATPTSTPTASSYPTPSSSSHAWIAGAVIGPVFFLFVAAVAFFFYRKRSRKHGLVPTIDDTEKKGNEVKPQLHGDSAAVKRHELQSNKAPDVVWELPALEPVGTELEGRKGVQAETSGTT